MLGADPLPADMVLLTGVGACVPPTLPLVEGQKSKAHIAHAAAAKYNGQREGRLCIEVAATLGA
jgi:hypothetical protein